MSRVRLVLLALPFVALSPVLASAQEAPEPKPAPLAPPMPAPVPAPAPAAEAPPDTALAEPAGAIPQGLVMRFGIAGIVLPEASGGTFSAQPELRLGWFPQAHIAIQIEGSARVWPLGPVAAHSFGLAGNLLWFPPISAGRRELYLLAGGGGYYTDPPLGGSSFDPALRAGVGVMAPMGGLVHSLSALRLSMEYRGEYLFADQTDFVSGIAIGFSRNL